MPEDKFIEKLDYLLKEKRITPQEWAIMYHVLRDVFRAGKVMSESAVHYLLDIISEEY